MSSIPQQARICELCERNTDEGNTYLFYYGKEVDKQRVENKMITRYRIAGSQETFICHQCMTKEGSKRSIVAGVSFVLFSLAIFFISIFVYPIQWSQLDKQNLTAVIIGACLLLGAVAFGLIMINQGLRLRRLAREDNRELLNKALASYSEIGDQISIQLFKEELLTSGHDSFFTRAQHKNLTLV